MTRARVLFVDDSKLMRLSGQRILAQDFDVVLAENVAQARSLLDDDPTIQLMFSDLNMPGQSGYDLLAELRENRVERLKELPIIIMTGSENQEAERRKALELGATDFINKPFRASELMARARAHASHKEAARRLRQMEDLHPTDMATGLGSRAYCIKRLEQAVSFALRHGQSLTLMHLHLAGLQALIEDLGEPYGRSALAKIGRVLSSSIRCEDTVFRTGKESFCFVLPATDAVGASVLQERFIPDLEALGLRPDGAALNVECHFSIDTPDLESCADADHILNVGLTRKTMAVESLDAPTMAMTDVLKLDVEQALAMIQRGEIDQVQAQLPGLLARLRPLLQLAAQFPKDDSRVVAFNG